MSLDRDALAAWRPFAAGLFDDLYAASDDGVGVTRDAYGDGEQAAHDLIAAAASAHGLDVAVDEARNLVIGLPGADPTASAVACGSHLDSVPRGGNFDGAAGVVAGLTVMAALKDAGIAPPRPIKLLALRAEESAWFGKSWLGAHALFGLLTANDLDRPRFDSGRRLGDYMADAGADVAMIAAGTRLLDPADIAAFLEVHIEQGPVLEGEGLPVAVVTGIAGNLRHMNVTCEGRAAHAGGSPPGDRQDAVIATADLLMRLDGHWQAFLADGRDVLLTHGMIGTDPDEHAISRIAGMTSFSIEIRSADADTLNALHRLVEVECRAVEAARGVRFVVDEAIVNPPAPMDPAWIDRLAAICRDRELPHRQMASGGGHDSAVFVRVGVPTAMLFVRNPHGSHNPDEAMDLDDFMAAVGVLMTALLDPLA